MKITRLVARILLGLMFLVFGLNGFLHFLPMVTPPGLAGTFLTTLVVSHYAVVVFAVQTIGGILLLANQYVPLALVILAPVIVNILTYHVSMQPAGLPPGLLATVLWLILASGYRSAFAPLLERKPVP